MVVTLKKLSTDPAPNELLLFIQTFENIKQLKIKQNMEYMKSPGTWIIQFYMTPSLPGKGI